MQTEARDFAAWLAPISAAVNGRLTALLPSSPSHSAALAAAMRDAVVGGGKRLRPAMVYAVAEADGGGAKGGEESDRLAAACALELIHCYSLVHDDLPCMDDDDFRRGKPSCHKAHGEAMAVLAGDCLQSLAFEVLATSGLPSRACALLARAAGRDGMGGGQALDVTAAARSADDLAAIHRLKTGALFVCALRLGLMCGGGEHDSDKRAALERYGREFGLLFQIANDMEDREQDARAGKRTYAAVATAPARAAAARAAAVAAVADRYPRLADIAAAVYPT